MPIHGTCVAIDAVGVLIRGAPGSGKSDLALRLIDGGARLVADDQVEITPRNGRLFARAPAAIAGRLEVRGVGILPVPTAPEAVLGLVVELAPAGAVERLPAPAAWEHAGIRVPLVRLAAFEASAAAKVRLAAAASTCGNIPPP
jgi:serine kinase of HPr protein (carbohydrate metabolism regulator)